MPASKTAETSPQDFETPSAVPHTQLTEEKSETLGDRFEKTVPGYLRIEHLPGGSRLGGGTGDHEPRWYAARLIRAKLQGEPENFWWAEMAGGAMAPNLAEGDEVLIDRRVALPVQPAIFAVDEGLGPVAKWVEYIPGSEPPRYRLGAADRRFAPYDLAADDIRIIGRVVWESRRL
ncbi:MAG TPA: hypothetical protein VHW90_14340 [Stellaceae bacterium]|jgi:hypothetical protein|nr:hypothetical protein [Stellaceae bacterium]